MPLEVLSRMERSVTAQYNDHLLPGRIGRLLLPIVLLLFCGLMVFKLAQTAPRQFLGSGSIPTRLRGPHTGLELTPDPRSSQLMVNFLDGCYHVYLDVGTNVGIQIRKLYEPHLYPDAKVLPFFDLYFGRERNLSEVCTVGFEPNPAHSQRLATLESSYQACSWPVWIFRQSAASDRSGTTTFFSDGKPDSLERGGGIVKNIKAKDAVKSNPVRLIRLSNLVLQNVAKRRLPRSPSAEQPPIVLMKMDIEGSEIEVISDLLVTGAFPHIQMSMIEWHMRLAISAERAGASESLQKIFPILSNMTKLFDIVTVDDETYFQTNFTLPRAGMCGKVTNKV